jgi:hypothetical protein
MKLLAARAMSAALVVSSVVFVSAANAQGAAPNGADQARMSRASDMGGPYGPYADAPPPRPVPSMPPRPYGYGYGPGPGQGPDYGYAPPPQQPYGYGGGYGGYGGGYGPPLMPPQEVYAVLRDNGFSPLGAPYQRGMTYVIAAMDRGGEDGRLVIDARNGRIIRFVPASRWGETYDRMGYEGDYPPGAMPSPMVIRGIPRPPAPIPRVASRTVPVPTPKPQMTNRPAEPTQQSAAVEAKPATPQAAPSAPAQAPNVTVGAAKPVPQIMPTQKMPAAQGLN